MVAVHLFFLGVSALGVLYADSRILSWMRGKTDVLSDRTLAYLHYWVGIGLLGLIISGGLLFMNQSYWSGSPVFMAKMVFVGVLILNSFFITLLSRQIAGKPFRFLPFRIKVYLVSSGALSLLGWVGAILLGFSLGG